MPDPVTNTTNSQMLNLNQGSGVKNIMGKDDFLQLLVTQLKMQDPMNPLQSHEFAAQLAQFSSVEQLSNIKEQLQENMNQTALANQSMVNTLAATLVGKKIKALGNYVHLPSSGSVKIHFHLTGYAEKVVINVYDVNGTLVRKITETGGFEEGDHQISWDGKSDARKRLPVGSYTYKVQAETPGGNPVNVSTFIEGIVSAVQYDQSGTVFRVGDLEIPIGDVYQVMATD